MCAAFLSLPSQTRLRSGSALLQSQSSTEDPKDEPAELKQDSEDLATQSAASKASQEEVNEIKSKRDEEERERERREKEREREREREKEKEREREKQKLKESEKERESAKDKEKGKRMRKRGKEGPEAGRGRGGRRRWLSGTRSVPGILLGQKGMQ